NQNEYLVTFEDGVARHDTDFSINRMYLQFPELVTGDAGLCINETPIIVHYLKDETTGKLSAFGSKYRGGETACIRNEYDGMPVTSIADNAFGSSVTGFMFNESGAIVFSGGGFVGPEFAISDIMFQDAETSQISVIGQFAFVDAFLDDGVSVSFDNFPDTINTLKIGAFQGSGITGNSDGVMNLSGVVTIENAVFSACENITAIEIGTTCTTLAVDFAEDATNLQYVHMLKSLFTNSGGKIATNPSGTTTIDYLKSSDKSPFDFGNSPLGDADDGRSAGLFVYEAKDSNSDGVIDSYLIGGAKDHVRSGDELLRLPNTYAGLPIVGTISRGFRDCDELKQVYIPFSLGANTAGFYHCSNLEKIIMTSACTTLRGSTLSYCPKLTTIGYETPSGQIVANDGIAELRYTTILQGNVLEYAGITDIVFSASTLKITATALLNMINLENIIIDTKVDTIATGFLAGLPNIKSIDVTDSSGKFTGNEDKTVLVYSKTAIRAAGGLEVVIPDGVTTIEANAFGTSEIIETLSLPSSLSSFDSAMLADLANLETLEIGRKISLSSLAIPATVTQLRARSGGETGKALLSSVTFAEGSNLEIIGDYAFYSYPQLSSFAFPSGVTTIGVSAFEKCTGLADTLSLPSALTTLGESAFKDCKLLTGVVVAPDLLEAIPEEAFYGCSGITSFKVSRSVESIDPSAFFHTSKLYGFDVDANNPKYEAVNEAIVEKSTKTIVRGCTMTKFESGILAVGPNAFTTVPTLGTVVLPEGVETIGDEAFAYCDGLITISIPASVTTIGEVICHASGDLTTINVNSNNAHYKKEGNCLVDVETKSIIQGCSGPTMTATMEIFNISDFAFHGMDINKAIVIPSSVRTIGYGAFMNADITGTLVIPASVESIGELAFSGNKFTNLQILTSKLLIGGNIFASSGSHNLETSLTSLATASNLGENAFDLYPNLASVEILPTVTEMGRNAFLGCSKLTSLIVNDMASFAEIEFANAQANPLYYAKKFDGVDEIDLTGATKIGSYAFCNMEYRNIDIPGSVESIGNYAFYVSALGDGGNVNIRRGVKTVGVCAFSNLRLLDSNTTQQQPYLSYIYFPDTISSIGAYVLSGSRTYSLYVYGDGSLNIGAYTFADATILSTLTLGKGINKIVSGAFSEVKTSQTSVFISSDVKQIAGGVSTGIEYSEIFYTAYVKWEGSFVGFNYTSMSISGDVPTGWETAWYATPNGRISVKNGEGYIEIGDVDALVENMLEEFDAGEFDGVYQENADIVGRGFAKNVVSFTLWDFDKFMNSDYYL
ncbi:MAG: leucine-rich repeat domain-containing protein, partial [Clostridia bacterium]|nr:leucine-rich repeat domain-containing protein [Clostridia bacterium]